MPSSGQGVAVTNGGTTPVNFDLAPGARIGGVVTDAASGSPFEFRRVYACMTAGDLRRPPQSRCRLGRIRHRGGSAARHLFRGHIRSVPTAIRLRRTRRGTTSVRGFCESGSRHSDRPRPRRQTRSNINFSLAGAARSLEASSARFGGRLQRADRERARQHLRHARAVRRFRRHRRRRQLSASV